VVVERYPKLRAIEEYERLSGELANTENRVNVARTCFNGTVREYNGSVLIFPNSILAKMWGFYEHDYYVNKENSENEARIKLD